MNLCISFITNITPAPDKTCYPVGRWFLSCRELIRDDFTFTLNPLHFHRQSYRDRLSLERKLFLLLLLVISRRLHLIKRDLQDSMMENDLRVNNIRKRDRTGGKKIVMRTVVHCVILIHKILRNYKVDIFHPLHSNLVFTAHLNCWIRTLPSPLQYKVWSKHI